MRLIGHWDGALFVLQIAWMLHRLDTWVGHIKDALNHVNRIYICTVSIWYGKIVFPGRPILRVVWFFLSPIQSRFQTVHTPGVNHPPTTRSSHFIVIIINKWLISCTDTMISFHCCEDNLPASQWCQLVLILQRLQVHWSEVFVGLYDLGQWTNMVYLCLVWVRLVPVFEVTFI